MEKLAKSQLKLGIIAGGQLGKMLIQEASKWDIATYVLDPDTDCPASIIATKYIQGHYLNFDDVYNFGKQVDILTYELENINIEALKKLRNDGISVIPDPDILELIQDKSLQKDFFVANGIPTANYKKYDNVQQINNALQFEALQMPFIQKINKGGYDGRGVVVVENYNDINKLIDKPCIVEDKISISKEISVIAARNKKGQIVSFPVVEMNFDSKANLVDKLICPANISAEQSAEARKIAEKLIEILNLQGLLAVEMFIDIQGKILVNEIAPRPHNSGHHTIESIVTSQFEQHIRAILDLPLGSTKLKLPAVMVNILGEEGYEGNVYYDGLEECMAIDGLKIHLYGKKITRPYRKMGHITIISEKLETALEKAHKVKQILKVKSWKPNL